MLFVKTFIKRSPLVSKFLWLGASEGVARITRLVTAIVLARVLTPFEFGIAAIVLSMDELIRVMSRNGIGMKIIQVNDEGLDNMCHLAHKWNWRISIVLCITQIALSELLAQIYSYPDLALLLQCLALTYLIYPMAMVNVYRVQRAQNMRATGAIYGTQVGIDNLLTAILAIAGLGLWAVVIPKLIVAPIWVFIYRRIEDWRFQATKILVQPDNFWAYCREILFVEMLRSGRMTWDRLIIGGLLGIETLGIYYFAVNAGSGLAQSLIKAFTTVLMPYICDKNRHKNAYVKQDKGPDTFFSQFTQQTEVASNFRNALVKYVFFIVPALLLQIVLAPWYVPLVFGEQWAAAISILMLLCAAMMFQGGMEILSPIFRAHKKTRTDFLLNLKASILVILTVVATSHINLMAVAIGIAIAQIIIFIYAFAQFLLLPLINQPMQLNHSEGLIK